MKKWICLLLMAIVLIGCSKSEEEKPIKKDKQPQVEVKVKTKKDEKTKKKQQTKSTEDTTQQATTEQASVPTSEQAVKHYNTDNYNLARNCLVTPGKEKTAECEDIIHTPEYSKAWNNLTSEGYICQSGQCDMKVQPKTQEHYNQPVKPATNEQKSDVPIATEVIPANPDKSVEHKTQVTTEQPQTTEAVDQATTSAPALKSTEQNAKQVNTTEEQQ
ncbi:hypothetical protein [Macrococcus capreoli]|uniref:hypothetical protein n=1 Tax=Macrococcus capreoli TaxID=2982690 RepID=UPI0021D5CB1B|nr:hypothetical protein [Macrococcus sp. TMW 2.2395]MCU7557740.1 hypothetical protein [Macrococcus sp. TMW 2.2395]